MAIIIHKISKLFNHTKINGFAEKFKPMLRTGFENPGHAGHMCPATFEIRQPHLAKPQA